MAIDIAIIGAGNVGKALGGSLLRAGHTVTLATDHAQAAAAAAAEIGGGAADSPAAAAHAATVVVLAVPYPAVEAVLAGAARELDGKIVVDATNPLTADYSGLALQGTSAAEEIQKRLPGARVVKAFNTLLAAVQATSVVESAPADAFVAADDADAKTAILDLAASMGLHPIDAGPLAMARYLEAMAFLNIAYQMRTGGSWQTAWKLTGPLG